MKIDLFAFSLFIVFLIILFKAIRKYLDNKKKLKQRELRRQVELNYSKTYETAHERYIAEKLINSGYFLPQFVFVDNYFRAKNGRTAQIDIIAVGKRGVFVIESKDYSGWIIGDGRKERWRQSFSKEICSYFYNPIKQNEGHINVLRHIVGEQKFFSMIIFGEKAELKDVTYVPINTYVLASHRISDVFMDILKNQTEILASYEIEDICKRINAARIKPDDNLRNEHIKQIKDELGSDRVYS